MSGCCTLHPLLVSCRKPGQQITCHGSHCCHRIGNIHNTTCAKQFLSKVLEILLKASLLSCLAPSLALSDPTSLSAGDGELINIIHGFYGNPVHRFNFTNAWYESLWYFIQFIQLIFPMHMLEHSCQFLFFSETSIQTVDQVTTFVLPYFGLAISLWGVGAKISWYQKMWLDSW